ncbi:MAG: hypothetical protein V3T84_07995 [Phycisphaerales bacterium]
MQPIARRTAAPVIVEAPSGKTFVRLLGPRETVAGHVKAFDELLRGLVVEEGA